jgi:hypothetical protein
MLQRAHTLPLFLLYLYIYSVILITEKGYTTTQWAGVQVKKKGGYIKNLTKNEKEREIEIGE